MHPHVEFLIYGRSARTSLENADRNTVHNMYCMSKQDVSMLWPAVVITHKKEGVSNAVSVGRKFGIFFGLFAPASLSRYANKQNVTIRLFFANLLNEIALQKDRKKQLRVHFRSNVCTLELEIFVFLDEIGFLRVIMIW